MKSKDKKKFMGLIKNPNLPKHIWKFIFEHDYVVSNISKGDFHIPILFDNFLKHNPDKIDVFLERYTSSNSPIIRLIIALYPQTPISALEALSNSLSWLERYAIAQNPNTPLTIRQKLAKDGNRVVRAAAKASLQKANIAID